jgi:hypothetical protein
MKTISSRKSEVKSQVGHSQIRSELIETSPTSHRNLCFRVANSEIRNPTSSPKFPIWVCGPPSAPGAGDKGGFGIVQLWAAADLTLAFILHPPQNSKAHGPKPQWPWTQNPTGPKAQKFKGQSRGPTARRQQQQKKRPTTESRSRSLAARRETGHSRSWAAFKTGSTRTAQPFHSLPASN